MLNPNGVFKSHVNNYIISTYVVITNNALIFVKIIIVNPTKILIADDEQDLVEFMKYNLERDGYQVYCAYNGEQAVEIANQELPQLVILDIMMPKKSGIQACEIMRTNPALDNSLIIFLTALADEDIHIKGLEVGADDYITKPLSPKILVSKVNALLRRNKAEVLPIVHQNEIVIDRESYTVSIHGETIDLPKKEFELLALLYSKPGKVFLRNEILDKVWGSEVIVGDRTIDVHVRKVRSKLGLDCIKTIKGVGYKFEIQ